LQECDAFLCNTANILDSEGKQQYFLQPVCRRVVTYYPTMLYKPSENCDMDAVLRYLKEEKTEVADNGDGSYTLTVKGDYRSNTQSDSCPNGFNQESTIREIFLGRPQPQPQMRLIPHGQGSSPVMNPIKDDCQCP
jgi:hypothetical protein